MESGSTGLIGVRHRIISAIREYLRDAAHDDDLKQEIAGAYYDDEITFEELQDLVGHEDAANFRVLIMITLVSYRRSPSTGVAIGGKQ